MCHLATIHSSQTDRQTVMTVSYQQHIAQHDQLKMWLK